MHRITTDKDTTKSIKGDNQQGESIYCSNYLFLSAFILLIHVQMLFLGSMDRLSYKANATGGTYPTDGIETGMRSRP